VSALLEKQSVMTQTVVRVGDGRGFVVKHGRERVILTAAHCLPLDADGHLALPPAFSLTEDRTYPKLLGPLGAEPTVWAECLFVNPVADIAVLDSPDGQVLFEQAEAYEVLIANATPLAIADAPKMGRKWVQSAYDGADPFEVDTEGQGLAYVLSLDGEWLKCTVTRWRTALSVKDEGLIASGMSGSPIVSMDGKAIGLLSTGGINPVLRDNLPAWFFRR
jgi:Trypsin-like peptidase domain